MSAYAVDLFLHRLSVEPDFRQVAQDDIAAACQDAGLTAGEQRAIEQGDVRGLYESGVTAFLLHHLLRFGICGLTLPQFVRSIKQQG